MEKHICPSCKRVLRNPNAWHYCKEVNIDDLFLNKSDAIVLVFDKLLQRVAEWQDVEISGTKNCVVFVKNKTFLVAKPMTKYLEIKFYTNEPIEDEDLFKCHVWSSKYEGIFRIQNEHELKTKHFQYFKDSYLIS
ncbi:MAG: hypothetical protein EAZ27_12705 [Cytophagales bacterium]|nr:MAG: hypothetical protein EAZ27_12705 [Cytophagales bacterium]